MMSVSVLALIYSLVLIINSFSPTFQDEIGSRSSIEPMFITRADGTILGPYIVRPFTHEADLAPTNSSDDDLIAVPVDNETLSEDAVSSSSDSPPNSYHLNFVTNEPNVQNDYLFLERKNGEVLGPYEIKPFSYDENELPNQLSHSLTENEIIEVGEEKNSSDHTGPNDGVTESNVVDVPIRQNDRILEHVNISASNKVTLKPSYKDSSIPQENLIYSDYNGDFHSKNPIQKQDDNISFPEKKGEDLTDVKELNNPTQKPISKGYNAEATPVPSHHADCAKQLDNMNFQKWPSQDLFVEGEPLVLKCSLPTIPSSTVNMLWLFQSIEEPLPQCSLIKEDTLKLCQHFPSVEHIIDTNITGNLHEEIMKLDGLTIMDTGYYMCMAEVICGNGSDSHTMNKLIRTDYPIVVYESGSYTAELVALGVAVTVLCCALFLGLFFEWKRRPKVQTTMAVPTDESPKKVLHAPLLAESDSDSFHSEREDV